MLLALLRAYLRSDLRGSTRIPEWLAYRIPSLHCAPVRVGDLPPVYLDLRQPTARSLLCTNDWGNCERVMMRKFVRPGDVVFDIGANVGLHTAYLSLLVGTEGKVYTFEPNPALARGLVRTCLSLGNAHLIEVALSDAEGTVPFFIPLDHRMASLEDWTGTATKTVHCEARRLDSLQLPQPSFIKCDVEGAELKVFCGAMSVLDRADAPVVLFEANVNSVGAFNSGVADATRMLASLTTPQYRFYAVSETDAELTELKDFSFSTTNVLAVPDRRAINI